MKSDGYVKDLILIQGELSGVTGATAPFPLSSDLFTTGLQWVSGAASDVTGPTMFRIPQGFNLKIWQNHLAQVAATTGPIAAVMLQFSKDITAVGGPTWQDIDLMSLAALNTEEIRERRRPLVIHAITGKEGVRLVTQNAMVSGATHSITIEVELTNEPA